MHYKFEYRQGRLTTTMRYDIMKTQGHTMFSHFPFIPSKANFFIG